MSAEQQLPTRPARRGVSTRLRWLLWAAALCVGVGVGAGIKLLTNRAAAQSASATAVVTWAAGARPAPPFSLRDERGRRFTLATLLGRPLIVTFIDPLCRNFCPREASVLSEAVAQLGAARPVIVSISVDPWADSPVNFREDALHWHLAPGWRWGVGSQPVLSTVWRRYGVEVLVSRRTIAGIMLRTITHTGAAYLIDATGHERALLLYP